MPELPWGCWREHHCASFLTLPWGTTCPSAFLGTNTCSPCGQTNYTQYGRFSFLVAQTSFQPMMRLKLIFSFSTTLLRREVEILPLTIMGVRLAHYSLDKEPFLTQVLEIKLTSKDCVCSETNNGGSLLYRDCSAHTSKLPLKYTENRKAFLILMKCVL